MTTLHPTPALASTLALLSLAFAAIHPQAADLANLQSVKAVTAPTLLRAAAADPGAVIVSVDSAGLTNATVTLTSPAWPQPKSARTPTTLAPGPQTLRIATPAITEPITANVRVAVGEVQREFGPFTLQPVRPWTLYLAQHTHTDIGYTRPQTEILPEHLRYIDYALDYCDLTDDLPDDARFRWTCETSWAVREYVRARPAQQLERLKRRVREGRIEICGLMLNMSEIAGESSLAALLRPLRTFREELGLPVVTAMQNDVNGAGWCLVDFFNDIGIRYLTMGINQTRSILPFDRPTPFWWVSPSGQRILAYRADHYMTANFWGIEKGQLDPFRNHLEKYLVSLEDRAYPFDRVGVQFSGYFTDNSPPSTAACELVKAWNETFTSPHLRLATAQEFLAWVEQNHAASLPVHRQAWPDWWTDGFGSAARETAAAREVESAMQVNAGLLAMASILGSPIPPSTLERFTTIQDDLLFYHEHTYGAAESISDPLAENTQVQWGEKAAYVWNAVKNSHQLREEAFGLVQPFLPRGDTPTLAVFNTLNWPRSGLVRVFIDHEMLPHDRAFRLLDGDQPVPVQAMETRAEGTYWAVWAREVPPLGFKILRLELDSGPRPKDAATPSAHTLENAFYQITLDPQRGGITQWIDRDSGASLIDPKSPWALGQLIYETMPNNREMKPDVFQRTTLRNLKLEPGVEGPVWKSLRFTADLDGCATNSAVRAEVRLYQPEKRLEIHFTLRKVAVRSPEALYAAFPFLAPHASLLYEAQGGTVVPGTDQIPGSSSDWQTVQSFLSVRHPGGQIVWGSEQAPLVQLGDFNLGKWQPITRVAQPHVYSWIMNNYWFTNFRAEQEGELRWHYYLTSLANTNRADATRFGWGSRIPLASRVLPPTRLNPARQPQTLSTLNAPAPNVLLVEARPTADQRFIRLHLRELEGHTTTLTRDHVQAASPPRGVDAINTLEQILQADLPEVTLKPFETRFLRVRFSQ